MHELSLVQGLLDQLETLADKHQTTAIINVQVEIGPLAGVVIDSFKFAFEALSRESVLTQNAQLEIIMPKKGRELTLLRVEME